MAGEASANDRLFTQVSRIRVEAGSLIDALGKLEAGVSPHLGADAGAAPVAAAIEAALGAWRSALGTAELGARREQLAELLNGGDDLHGYAEDSWSVFNGLSQLLDRWPASLPREAGAIVAVAKESRAILGDVIFHCGGVTIPREVEEQLATLRVGKPLDFHASFEGRLADPAQRKQVLTAMKDRRIGGWVDTGAGLIYRLPAGRAARALSCIAPLLLALFAAGLMYLIPTFDLPKDWDLGDRWQLVGAFGLVLAGAAIHLLVENVKQLQTRTAPIVAISDGVYWLSLRWVGLALTVLWALVVAIGLRVIGLESTGSEGVGAYLAAGYSLDSVAGLVLTRFNSSAGVLLERVNRQLQPPAEGGGGAGGQEPANA